MKCLVCEYESDNKEDFNDSSPGRSLCKMRGTWECVRDWYTIHFMQDSKHSAESVEDKIKEIKANAKLDRIKKQRLGQEVLDLRWKENKCQQVE